MTPFAAGREADVFALDDTRVLRRYRNGGKSVGEHPIGAGAGELLDLFPARAPGEPLRELDHALAIRLRNLTMSADELARLPRAAARVRGVS